MNRFANGRNRFFYEKNIFFVFLLITNQCVFGHGPWSPWHTTLPVEGKITDAITGEPIENVVIVCRWATTKPAMGDNVSGTAAVEVVITDKDGRYRIPGKTTFHFPPLLFIGSWFDQMHISVIHPLYETKNYYNFHIYETSINKWIYRVYNPEINVYEEIKGKDGKIQLDIKLLSLEEKYKNDEWKEEYIAGLPSLDPEYFKLLKKCKNTFDLDRFFSEAYKILDEKYKKHPAYNKAKLFAQEKEKEIRQLMSKTAR